MSVRLVSGDLFAQKVDAYAFNVSTGGGMDSVLTAELASFCPRGARLYSDACTEQPYELGDVCPVEVPSGPFLYNMVTQMSGEGHTYVHAVQRAIPFVLRHARVNKIRSVGMKIYGNISGVSSWQNMEPEIFSLIMASPVCMTLVSAEGFD